MTGRLGMVGPAGARGDKAVGRLLFTGRRKAKETKDPTAQLLAGTQLNLERFNQVRKVATTMSDAEAARLSRRYDTRGPLPKDLSRPERMRAYEARYVHSGGRKAEKWKRRADTSEVVRNAGLAGATLSAAGILASRGRHTGRLMRRTPGVRRLTSHHLETTGLVAAAGGGGAELYGEHARSRRASYQNSPAGVAGSALSRMQAYTPRKEQR